MIVVAGKILLIITVVVKAFIEEIAEPKDFYTLPYLSVYLSMSSLLSKPFWNNNDDILIVFLI